MNFRRFTLLCVLNLIITIVYTQQDSVISDTSFYKLSFEELLNVRVSTASKRDQAVKDIPASIVVYERSEIEKLGYLSLEDLIADIPGFYSLGDAYYYGGTNYGVRGFSSVGAFTDVMILVNGVNQMEDFQNGFSTDMITVPIAAIDRIEVVRGPATLEYGSTAFMGVINIITNEVKGDELNQVSVSTGSLATHEAAIRLSGKINEAQYTVNASYSKTEGQEIAYTDLQPDTTILSLYNIESDASTKGQLGSETKHVDFSAKISKLEFNF